VLESVSWFDFNGIQRYISGMVVEFFNLSGLLSERIVMLSSPTGHAVVNPKVVTILGDWGVNAEITQYTELPPDVAALVLVTFQQKETQCANSGCTLFSRHYGVDLVVFAAGSNAFSNSDVVLLDVLMSKVCQALNNYQTFSMVLEERNEIFRALIVQEKGEDSAAVKNLERVAKLATATVQRLEMTLAFPDEINDEFKRDIGIAAMLHDLGNQLLPPDLLNKPEPLSQDEHRIMRMHIEKGMRYLSDVVGVTNIPGVRGLAQQIIAGHHERYDGSGYPSGLQGGAIPLAARVVTVAESFVSLTTDRPNHPALSDVQACSLLKSGAGSRYDPVVVHAFVTVLGLN
jgi:HD-GYP domain-containing protein (c-di-GMP phosphodiesterase class II)